MKRRYVVIGLGLIAVLALATTAIAGGGIGAHASKKAKVKAGPPGPAGPAGAAGAQGPQGPQGSAGTSALTLRACVNGDATGTLCTGTSPGVVDTHTTGTGLYSLDFGQSLVNCSAMANLGNGNAGEIATTPVNPNNNSVQVQTRSSVGAGTDILFRIVVIC